MRHIFDLVRFTEFLLIHSTERQGKTSRPKVEQEKEKKRVRLYCYFYNFSNGGGSTATTYVQSKKK